MTLKFKNLYVNGGFFIPNGILVYSKIIFATKIGILRYLCIYKKQYMCLYVSTYSYISSFTGRIQMQFSLLCRDLLRNIKVPGTSVQVNWMFVCYTVTAVTAEPSTQIVYDLY